MTDKVPRETTQKLYKCKTYASFALHDVLCADPDGGTEGQEPHFCDKEITSGDI